jgi:hypothetical protein
LDIDSGGLRAISITSKACETSSKDRRCSPATGATTRGSDIADLAMALGKPLLARPAGVKTEIAMLAARWTQPSRFSVSGLDSTALMSGTIRSNFFIKLQEASPAARLKRGIDFQRGVLLKRPLLQAITEHAFAGLVD